MNQDMLKGKWTEIKGEIQKSWGKITNDEIEKTKGDAKQMAGLLQQKYGLAKEEAAEKINKLYSKFEAASHDVKKSAEGKVSKMKDSMKHS